ncbi:FkbM family methyltransferase [Allobranchiibius sp. CTAmp26]|uniref:FkbM family methyltransferase n=1 Tax=Allobranchiibius sp. CTAmp26 TaxID=2815214 RepID=UPI001AA12673|nr:FkbM family methyltransferase [Allobranchiibius sp. CTAmp26]MBO1755219.1 FkbM family methyltransferase [Allobranchiibius sp. CTAmp26]
MTVDPRAVLLDLQMRHHAAQLSTALDGRGRSARALDDLFHAIVEALEPELFLEVGAFEASASHRVRAALPQCRVVAFEASPVNYEHHRGVTDFDGAGIEYLHYAVCDRVGTTTILLNLEHPDAEPRPVGWTSMLRHRGFEHVRSVEVPATTLDDVVPGTGGPIALWVDVEGAAGLVLDGAAHTLPRVDVLKIEVEDLPSWEGQTISLDITARLLEAGLYAVARDVEYSTQHNVVFLSERALRSHQVQRRLDLHLYDVSHRLSREPHPLRRSERLRGLARPVRRLVHPARSPRGRR